MKLRNDQLTNHLKNNLAPIYIISGDEPQLVQEACDKIKDRAQANDFSDRIIMQVESGFDWLQFTLNANTSSLFSKNTLLDLRLNNLKLNDAGKKALISYGNNPPADKILLITSKKLDSATQKTAWFKALDSAGINIAIWPPTASELAYFVRQRLQQKGLSTNNDGINLLLTYTEGNLLATAQEIEKLHLLYGQSQLSPNQISDAIIDNARFNIFDLADNFLKKEQIKTIRILHELHAEKVEPILILWAITREIRLLLTLHNSLKQDTSFSQLVTRHRIWTKREPLIRFALDHYPIEKLEHKLLLAANIDRVIKGATKGNVWDELETLCAGD